MRADWPTCTRDWRALRQVVQRGTLAVVLGLGGGCERGDGASAPEVLRGVEWTDQDGQRLGAGAPAHELLLLNFMFTSCPSACPRLTLFIKQALAGLPSDVRQRVHVLSISVDPDNDSPVALKQFAHKNAADEPRWRFAQVSASDLELLASRLQVFDPNGPRVAAAHSLSVYLFDRSGKPVQRYDGGALDPAHLSREVTALARLQAKAPLAQAARATSFLAE